MWGIIPAAGNGTRIQPLAFSKELLPVGSRHDGTTERPKAVSEYLVERFMLAGVRKICFVIGPGKLDIVHYYGAGVGNAEIAFVVQTQAAGLCDAIFRAAPLIAADEPVAVGLPDTIWFPERALLELPSDRLSFLLFPVANPQLFDSVITEPDGRVAQIEVKSTHPRSGWIWGAFRMPGRVFHELHGLWKARGGHDEYFGTLVNAWIAGGGDAVGARAGTAYVDVGTLHGYREAMQLLSSPDAVAQLHHSTRSIPPAKPARQRHTRARPAAT